MTASDSFLASDHDLLVRIQHGDVDAFEALYRAYYTSLCAFATTFVLDTDTARDIVSDVFVALWEDAVMTIHTSLKSYLFTATRNRALNYLRGKRREDLRYQNAISEGEVLGMGDSPETPDSQVMASLPTDGTLWAAVAQLNERARTVITLRWREQMRMTDIAKILGVSEGAADKIQRRALDTLAKILPNLLD